MSWVSYALGVAALLLAVPRLRHGGWRRVVLPFIWVVAVAVATGSVRPTIAKVVGIVAMVVGGWWLSEWSAKRFPPKSPPHVKSK